MDATYLDAIVAHHRRRAAGDARDWRVRVETVRVQGPGFASALRAPDTVVVIAEIKRRSPSRGGIDEGLDAAQVARDYQRGGAAALSVLTDAEFFGGGVGDLAAAREAVALPLLRKDFTVCENDVLDAAQMGAAAVLLIVAALSDAELAGFLDLAGAVGLDALVEVHDAHEARRAIDAGATLIGVNQRDLRTFTVEPGRAAEVAASLPPAVMVVAESGLSTRRDVHDAAAAGVDAVLVGEALIRSADRAAAVSALCGVAKVARV
ncbi:MAG: indole-3-glycerol-phosphate synthase [Acidobacteriota bacterium]|nr:indole-3-glycerol-phosphate synthase [Acidobacteriota bacterium]